MQRLIKSPRKLTICYGIVQFFVAIFCFLKIQNSRAQMWSMSKKFLFFLFGWHCHHILLLFLGFFTFYSRKFHALQKSLSACMKKGYVCMYLTRLVCACVCVCWLALVSVAFSCNFHICGPVCWYFCSSFFYFSLLTQRYNSFVVISYK